MPDKRADITSENTEGSSKAVGRDGRNTVRDGRAYADKESNQAITGMVIAEANDDPYRRRIAKPVYGLRKWIRRALNWINPPPSPEDILRMEDKKRARLLAKTLEAEARELERRIPNSLAHLGFAYYKKDQDGNGKLSKKIRFRGIWSNEDGHYLWVDTNRWVPGVNSADIMQQQVINHLSYAVGHKVNVRASPEEGIWFIVERASGMMGIPVHVTLADMWKRFPPTANGLTIPIGMTNNRKPVFDDVDSMVHTLIAGQTGGGKSNLMNVLIVTLITRNTPDRVKLLLLDAKAGLEFQYFEGIPHLLKIPDVTATGIIEDPEKFPAALKWIVNVEAKIRLDKIRAAGHRDVKSYNARRKGENVLPRIVVFVDEWGAARMAEGGDKAERELVRAVQLLRAAGIHFIIGTQTPSKDVLGVLARANFPTRVALSCSELAASMLIIGDSSAVNLGTPGRCIYAKASKTPVQIPYISEEMVKSIVAEVIAGKHATTAETPKHDVTQREMLEWAIENNSGSLRWQTIHLHFGHRGITQKEILDEFKAIEGQTVDVNGVSYFVQPGAGRNPRRLVVVEDQEETQDAEEIEDYSADSNFDLSEDDPLAEPVQPGSNGSNPGTHFRM